MEKLLTTEQVADLLQLSKFTVYRMSVEQVIPAFKIGKVWRIREADLEKWIDAKVKTQTGRKRAPDVRRADATESLATDSANG